MKQLILFLFVVTGINLCQAQTHPIQLWVYANAGYYFPSAYNSTLLQTHDGYNAGTGVYGMVPLNTKFSAHAGIGYRYLVNGQTYYMNSGTEITTEFREYAKHYLTLPVQIRYTTKSKFFFESGVEAAWLLNYKYTTSTTEFNWLLGTGICLGKMDCSIQYIQALGAQSIGGKVAGGPWEQEDFKNRSLNIQLAYPLTGNK